MTLLNTKSSSAPIAVRPRLTALTSALGGWRSWPGIDEDTARAWRDQQAGYCYAGGGGVYAHEAHDELAARIRAAVLAPTGIEVRLWPELCDVSDEEVLDHATELMTPDGGQALWCSPFIDARRFDSRRRDSPGVDAHVYAQRVLGKVNASGIRAVVLGAGAYAPDAADLLIWPRVHDGKVFPFLAKWPTPDVRPRWWPR